MVLQLTSHVMVEQVAEVASGCSLEELGHEPDDCLKTDFIFLSEKKHSDFFALHAQSCFFQMKQIPD